MGEGLGVRVKHSAHSLFIDTQIPLTRATRDLSRKGRGKEAESISLILPLALDGRGAGVRVKHPAHSVLIGVAPSPALRATSPTRGEVTEQAAPQFFPSPLMGEGLRVRVKNLAHY